MTHRIIALIDMDCFYCQVESRLDPTLVGKPMAVVQYRDWKGGGIIAVNYEARSFGVTRQMRGDDAKQRCSDILLVKVPEVRGKADLTKYRDAGKEVIDVLLNFGGIVERASVDEAYLDISDLVDEELEKLVSRGEKVTGEELTNTFVVGYNRIDKDVNSWIDLVHNESNLNVDNLRLLVGAKIIDNMRCEILKETRFRCSAGIAHNKMLAKFACGINKPNKQTILPHDQVDELFTSVPISKLRGLGGKLGMDVCMKLNCEFVSDLAKLSLNEIRKSYDDKTSQWLFSISKGLETEEVKNRDLPKSIGCGKNFRGPEILDSKEKVEFWMKQLSEELTIRLTKDKDLNKRVARCLTVSVNQEGVGHRTLSGQLSSYETTKIVRQGMELIAKLNQSKDKTLWRPKLLNLSVSSSKFEEMDSSGKIISVANFFESSISASSSGINISTPQLENNVEGRDIQNKICIPSTLAKELFPSLWLPNPSMSYDSSLLKSLPHKLQTEVRARIKLLQHLDNNMSDIQRNTIRKESALSNSEGPSAFVHNNQLKPQRSSTEDSDCQELDQKNSTENDLEECPKCSALVSPFELPEHLDLHLAKEMHKEIQRDFRKRSEGSNPEDKRNNSEKKRKYSQKTVLGDITYKKQTDITSFLVKK